MYNMYVDSGSFGSLLLGHSVTGTYVYDIVENVTLYHKYILSS